MKKYEFTDKTPEQIAAMMNESLKGKPMTEQEQLEDDADGGYFQQDED